MAFTQSCVKPAYRIPGGGGTLCRENKEMKFVLKDITNFTSRVLSDGKHLRFDIPLNKGNLQALYFNCSNEIEQLQQKKTISLIGTLKINKYLNTESINMIIEDMK